MADYKVVDSTALDEGLRQISNSIRAKTGGEDELAFPTGMSEAIDGISGGGVTSWNDLEDKPFGDGPITEDTVFSISFDGAEGIVRDDGVVTYLVEDLPVEADKEYVVVFDGVRYELMSFVDIYGYIILGDSSGYPTEDIPFTLFKSIDAAASDVGIQFHELTNHHVEILTQNRSYNTIDIKYLPPEALSPCYIIPEKAGALLHEFELSADDLSLYENGEAPAYTGGVDYVDLYAGQWYQVELDGELYSVECFDDYYDYIGDTSFIAQPFYLFANGSIGFATPGPHTMKIYTLKAAEVVQLDPKFIPARIHADWNENDPSSLNYISNRPFYEYTFTNLLYSFEADGRTSNRSSVYLDEFTLEVGKRYLVEFDGGKYDFVATNSQFNTSRICLGEVDRQNNIDIQFDISYHPGIAEVQVDCEYYGMHHIKISEITESYVGKKLDSKYLPEDAIADWDTGDTSSPSYVKNRTHWKDFSYKALSDEITVELKGRSYSANDNYYYYKDGTCFYADNKKMFRLEEGRTYRVTDNGNVYYLTARKDHYGANYIGNYYYVVHGAGDPDNTPHDTDVQIAIWDRDNSSLELYGTIGTHVITVELEEYTYHPLGTEYLPMDDIANAVLSAIPTWTGGSY